MRTTARRREVDRPTTGERRRPSTRTQRGTRRDPERPREDSTPSSSGHSLVRLHRSRGNRAVQRLVEDGLQAKLEVGRPNDRYEREADRVAERVVRESAGTVRGRTSVGSAGGRVQRLCPRCRERARLGQPLDCPACERELQREEGSGPRTPGNGRTDAPPVVGEVLRSPGRPLEPTTRRFMEGRFGRGFGGVRVHTDSRAAASARAVNARAYTVGSDVVFGANEYAPGTTSGRRLLAHELTHVIQQGHGAGRTGPRGISRLAGSSMIQRLGANPGCTDAQRDTIHQAIYNARGWLNKAIPQLEADPLSERTVRALRRNFGPTYGVPANAPLIRRRLQVAYGELSTIPIGCSASDSVCPGPCGHAVAGSDVATICTNPTLNAGTDWRYQAGCVLHESLHAAFSNFTVDEYSGWHGASSSTPTYPGGGTDPLLNADSYTTLSMDLS